MTKEEFVAKNYKKFLIVPILLLLFSIGILVNNYSQTGEWFARSVELKGGTLISISIPSPVDISELEKALSESFGAVSVRELRGLAGYGISIETDSETESSAVMQELESMGIDTTDSSIETIGPALGGAFWYQAQIGIAMAFIFMGIIVFLIFRTALPSLAVILAALSDILITLAFMQIFGIELSLAGLAAILMIIGYSVDTDILLTTRFLRGSGLLIDRIKRTLKTSLTMSFTSIGALAALLLFGISPVLSQIAMVLLIGLSVDIVITWLQNSVLLRWYCEKRGII